MNLTAFHLKVSPSLVVIREQTAFLTFLRNGQVTDTVRIGAPCEVFEIGIRQELLLTVIIGNEILTDEDVLLMNCITFAQSLDNRAHQVGVVVVTVNVSRIFLHGIGYFQDGRVFTCLGVNNADTIVILDGEVDVLKNFLTLTACSKDGYGDCHSYKDCKEYEYYV